MLFSQSTFEFAASLRQTSIRCTRGHRTSKAGHSLTAYAFSTLVPLARLFSQLLLLYVTDFIAESYVLPSARLSSFQSGTIVPRGVSTQLLLRLHVKFRAGQMSHDSGSSNAQHTPGYPQAGVDRWQEFRDDILTTLTFCADNIQFNTTRPSLEEFMRAFEYVIRDVALDHRSFRMHKGWPLGADVFAHLHGSALAALRQMPELRISREGGTTYVERNHGAAPHNDH